MATMFVVLIIFLFVLFGCVINKIDNITHRIKYLEIEIEKLKNKRNKKEGSD